MTQKIDLLEVGQIVDAIIRHAVAKRDSSNVTLGQNLYWHLPSPGVYQVKKDAPEPDIGSLHDDWDFIKDIAAGEQEPLANNLVGLAQLLRYLGEVLGDELAKDGG
jgi:hypothetical protein